MFNVNASNCSCVMSQFKSIGDNSDARLVMSQEIPLRIKSFAEIIGFNSKSSVMEPIASL